MARKSPKLMARVSARKSQAIPLRTIPLRSVRSKPLGKKVTESSAKKRSSAFPTDPQSLSPQLATRVDHPPEGPEWIHEIKFDGYRLLGWKDGGEIKLLTRRGHDWTHKFPRLAQALAELKVEKCVVDGEAVVLDEKGATKFQLLQNALRDGDSSALFRYYLFDLLFLGDVDLRDQPLKDRRSELQKILQVKKPAKKLAKLNTILHFSQNLEMPGAELLKKVCSLGGEGILSKLSTAPYRPGRSLEWVKSKCIEDSEFVVVGFTTLKDRGETLGALLLGYYEKGKLLYCGKVGTGFNNLDRDRIFAALKKLKIESYPTETRPDLVGPRAIVTWVKPVSVVQIEFTEWTNDGHLRHPSFKGVRTDKKPTDVHREIPLRIE